MQTVFEALGGSGGVLNLAKAWHARAMADEVVSHAFSAGYHPEHVERLAAYWSEALGGPTTYSDTIGDETTVVRIHSGNGPHEDMDRRAIACFEQALEDIGLGPGRSAAQGAARLLRLVHDDHVWPATRTARRRSRRDCSSRIGLGMARSTPPRPDQPVRSLPTTVVRRLRSGRGKSSRPRSRAMMS